ncbi:prepilin-type N-terminal cleavage/methylation domain-containing protein [Thermodesulfatator atlanticus]|uniref:prepilin-type N-terminal cleavage/methylation domain-containing protein n=1 Tax=Thermodesulfatator atlanticus TaxID=501497 RepID=UPI0003B42CD5|nr:prepilin-type N-terminal cleavage/methylation domain-containing protein [Thermodesulfatator atlanticus]
MENLNLSKNGFTMVELAIVLVVLGLLLGIGVTLIGPLIKTSKIRETKKIMEEIVYTIRGYALTTGTLPSPVTICDASIMPKNIFGKTKDSWRKEIRYLKATLDGNEICNSTTTNLKIYFCKDCQCLNYEEKANIAFLLVSGGPNYNIQTGLDANIVKIYPQYQQCQVDNYECNNPDYAYKDPQRQEEYDDIVEYWKLETLKGAVCGTL